MMNYVVIIEECKNGGYSAYVPDLPGCISVGNTMSEMSMVKKTHLCAEDYGVQAQKEMLIAKRVPYGVECSLLFLSTIQKIYSNLK
jgi:hypothetical protein